MKFRLPIRGTIIKKIVIIIRLSLNTNKKLKIHKR